VVFSPVGFLLTAAMSVDGGKRQWIVSMEANNFLLAPGVRAISRERSILSRWLKGEVRGIGEGMV
jgi:hypothetical protein